MSGDKSFFFAFRKRFDDCLEVLCEKLELLRTPENAVIADELRNCLIASKIHGKVKEICDDLSEKYRLQSAGTYYDEIRYDVRDPSDFEAGLAKLFAKGFMRYGFSCCEAIHAIEQNAQSVLEGFQADLNSQIQDEILASLVEPTQRLLPKLREPAI